MPDSYAPGDRVRNTGYRNNPDLPIGTPGTIGPMTEGNCIYFIADEGAVPEECRRGYSGLGWALYADEVEPLVAAE